ncbi:FAD-dependent oxidoreductase [Parendozoicomonas sp. Alg238-R29]|uniref:NAD(P)/FAD-dependent oxidoreductase n=1 Tax=Parendozoicomonas sp. Alg238-R29 TaxID=2993446 RepID=UPI00248D661F|nr:FAD-dependent oxidoreductase [Parendozoicomonas sp. Alg238-R29]
MDPIVIVGTGLAGYTLAREFRKLDSQTPLVLITSDDGRNYSKPMLSTGFAKNKDADGLAMQSPEVMAEQLNARILTSIQVNSIDRAGKRLLLNNGLEEAYSKLVLAQGAETIKPPVGGDALDKVFSVNDLQDYGKFRKALPESGKVAILGAGLIGCEFANDLRTGGYEVTVIAPSSSVMPGLLPSAAADAVKTGLTEIGVEFYLEQYVTEVNQADNGVSLTLDNGNALEVDVVLSAIGLRPRTALAGESGLKVNKGICVNRALATEDSNIYALGDCAEVDGLNLLYVMPLMACARALAKTLYGDETSVIYGAMPVTVKTPACPVIVSPPAGNGGEWQIENAEGGLRILNKKGDKLLGYALTGSAVSERMKLNKLLPAVMP